MTTTDAGSVLEGAQTLNFVAEGERNEAEAG